MGVVLPDIENPFFTSLVKGVEQAASAKGWNVIFCNTDEDIRREEALVGALVDRKIDGLILCPAAGSHDYMTRYLERRLPLVAVNRALRDLPLPAVTSDNVRGAYDVMQTFGRRVSGRPGSASTRFWMAGIFTRNLT